MTYSAAANGTGGIYHGFVDGKLVNLRVGPSGQILPDLTRVAAATNEMKVDDLPFAVREAIRNSMPYAEVTRIRKGDSASGDLYDITLRGDGRQSSMQISENGSVIRETRDLPILLSSAPVIKTNEPPVLEWATLPKAVKESVETRTKADAVQSMILTSLEGKTVFAVDFLDKDTLRNRIYIGKNGVVVNTQTNLFGIAHTGLPVAVADLPEAARTVIEAGAPSGTVTQVDLAMRGLTPVYVVSYLEEGETRQMVVTREGARIDAAGSAAATETGDFGSEVK